jgi:hypothetical protein
MILADGLRTLRGAVVEMGKARTVGGESALRRRRASADRDPVEEGEVDVVPARSHYEDSGANAPESRESAPPDFIGAIEQHRWVAVLTFTAPILLSMAFALFGAYLEAAVIAFGGIVFMTFAWRSWAKVNHPTTRI